MFSDKLLLKGRFLPSGKRYLVQQIIIREGEEYVLYKMWI